MNDIPSTSNETVPKGTPYTYLIGWSKHNRWYYGVRYSKNCCISDIWTTYFTSSDYVRDFAMLHGKPDVIQIRRTFSNSSCARFWERRVLIRMRVTKSDKWLNKTDTIGISGDVWRGKKQSEEHIRKRTAGNKKPVNINGIQFDAIGAASRYFKTSNEFIKKCLKQYGDGFTFDFSIDRTGHFKKGLIPANKNKKCPEIAEARKKYWIEWHKTNVVKKQIYLKKGFTAEVRQRRSAAVTEHNKVTTTCPYCQKTGQRTNMLRWHFDKCKLNEHPTCSKVE